jgi:alkylhydroperoxidase/carboxymuconolactone decarboxylase family protein YurZ
MPNDETEETPVQDTLVLMTAASLENCRLDARELMLVRLAALVAVDAPSPSYVMSIGAAAVSDPGITLEDARDILVAVAPIVGTARVLSATVNMGEALGFVIAETAEAAMEANEG